MQIRILARGLADVLDVHSNLSLLYLTLQQDFQLAFQCHKNVYVEGGASLQHVLMTECGHRMYTCVQPLYLINLT